MQSYQPTLAWIRAPVNHERKDREKKTISVEWYDKGLYEMIYDGRIERRKDVFQPTIPWIGTTETALREHLAKKRLIMMKTLPAIQGKQALTATHRIRGSSEGTRPNRVGALRGVLSIPAWIKDLEQGGAQNNERTSPDTYVQD
jgi:hypothetical protein